MTKEFLAEHNMEEAAAQFDQELQEYQKLVNETPDKARLEEMEKEVMAEQDVVNAYLKTVQYPLSKSTEFEGETYTLSEIAKDVVYFLNKKTVEWKYTLGLHQLVQFWKNAYKDGLIDYYVYDSTLRTLNQVQFTGDSEWTDILACNEFFRTSHEAYSKDTSWLIFESEKHNMIMDRMKQLDTLAGEIEQQ